MAITGIIVEYNPFHNGHLYQINEIKKQKDHEGLIVVMSGQFTQRGTPCITDKFTRAQMCLSHGVDMVLELPVPYATASAQRFSEAAVSLMHQTGIVDRLSFGCETNDLELMKKVAATMHREPLEVSLAIQHHLSQGLSYPQARQRALIAYLEPLTSSSKHPKLHSLLQSPNNILALEYLRALAHFKSKIVPMPIARTKAQYHEASIHHSIASATAIRHHLSLKDFPSVAQAMPTRAYNLLLHNFEPLLTLDDYSHLFHYKLIFSSDDDLYALWDLPKNLCLSLRRAAKTTYKLSEIIDQVTSKTYTRATVSRAVLRLLLGITSSTMATLEAYHWIPYIRVLACRKDRKDLLSLLSRNASRPIITNFGKDYKKNDPLIQSLLTLEVAATQLYALGKQNPQLATSDYTHSLFSPQTP